MNRAQQVSVRPTGGTKPSIGNEIRDRCCLLARLLNRLLQINGDPKDYEDEFNAAAMLLQTLPLASDPYGLAMNRIFNARRYLASHEVGAARYELRLLAYSLKTVLPNQISVEAVS